MKTRKKSLGFFASAMAAMFGMRAISGRRPVMRVPLKPSKESSNPNAKPMGVLGGKSRHDMERIEEARVKREKQSVRREENRRKCEAGKLRQEARYAPMAMVA